MRQVIVLETRKGGDGVLNVRGMNWYPIVQVAARVPRPQFVSAGVGLPGALALTAPEQSALEDGSVREEVFEIALSASTNLATVKADLARRRTDRAAAITAEPPTRQFYGLSWDGTAWSA